LEEPTDARPAGVTAAPSAQPAAETTAAASERPAYVVDVPAGGDDFPAAPREGWQDLFDPREAQNRTEVRTIPPRPIAGEPTRLLMIVTTNDNQPRPRVSVRLTGPNAQGGRPAAPIEPAGGWAEMVVVGGLYDEPRAGKMVPIRSVESVLSTTQAGESHYQIGLALPPGQFGMEVQFDIDGATETVASPVLNLDVQTSPSRGDPPAFR
jgi:hypothetical protein